MSESSEGDSPRIEDGGTPKGKDYRRKAGERAREFLERVRFNKKSAVSEPIPVIHGASSLDEERKLPPLYEPQPDNLPDVDVTAEELRLLVTEDPQRLAELLPQMRISKTGASGALVNLYKPVLKSDQSNSLAIKIIRTEHNDLFDKGTGTLIRLTDEQEMQAVLDSGRVIFSGREHPQVSELNPTERKFLLLALEHAKHEEFYGDYVIPAAFITYTAPHDVFSEFPLPAAGTQKGEGLRKINRRLGYLTTDDRTVALKKGQMLYAMVQKYEDMGPSVFKMRPESLTEDQKNQLRTFADTVQSVYESTGYFPDNSMWKFASGNLRFNSDGKLILIDTNRMMHTDEEYYPDELLQKLRAIAQ